MIKRADISKINREKATKEQIAENFKRLAIDNTKKVELKPSVLKTQKTLDGKTFGIVHENKTYYLKYTDKNGSVSLADFKHLDGLNSRFSIEKHNSFDKASNKMSFICEAQNNAHKLRLLNEEEDIIDDTEDTKEIPAKKVTSDSTEEKLLGNLDKEKASAEAPAADMSGEEPAMDMGATPAPESGEEPAMSTTATGEGPKDIANDILGGIGDAEGGEEPAAPEGGEEAPAADMGAEPAAPEGEEVDPKKEFQEAVGKLGQTINDLQDADKLDPKDIKNAMNSLISAIGSEGFKELSDKEKESFYNKIKGSQESEAPSSEEEEVPAEEAPEEEVPSEEKLDENFLRKLKAESKKILKEQLAQEIIKRKRNILIEGIKRKLK